MPSLNTTVPVKHLGRGGAFWSSGGVPIVMLYSEDDQHSWDNSRQIWLAAVGSNRGR